MPIIYFQPTNIFQYWPDSNSAKSTPFGISDGLSNNASPSLGYWSAGDAGIDKFCSILKETVRYYKRCFITNFSGNHIGKSGHMIPT